MTSAIQTLRCNPLPATRQPGFTLIELLVTVAIVAILAAIAYPSYTNQVAKARRAEMEAELMSLAGFMERIYTETGCYSTGCADDAEPDISNVDIRYDYYDIGFESIDAVSFELKATPTAGTAQVGDGNLHINHLGERWRD